MNIEEACRMGFCKQCGKEYAEGQTFCKECGVPIKGKQEVPLSQSEQRKPWKKSHKILLITALLLMGGLYGGHQYMKSLYTPDKTVESFAAAVSKADVKRAEKIMNLDSIKQGKDEKGMKSYLAYLDTDLPYLTDQLEEHARSFRDGKLAPATITDENGNGLFTFMKGEKAFGIYDTYTLKVIPFNMAVYSDIETFEVILDGEKVTISEGNHVIKGVLPGGRPLTGTFDGSYSTFEEKQDFSFTEAYDNELEVSMDFGAGYVYLDEYGETSTLLINGKKQEKLPYDTPLGPFATDGSVTATGEFEYKGKTYKSEPLKIQTSGSNFLSFEYPELDSIREAEEEAFEQEAEEALEAERTEENIRTFIEDYTYESVQARNEGDFWLVEYMHHPDGEAYAESRDFIEYLYENDIKEEVIDFKVISIEEDGKDYLVTTQETFDIEDSAGEVSRKRYKTTYRITASAGVLQVWELIETNEI